MEHEHNFGYGDYDNLCNCINQRGNWGARRDGDNVLWLCISEPWTYVEYEMKEVIEDLRMQIGENNGFIQKMEEDIQYHTNRLKDIQQQIRKTQLANQQLQLAIETLEKENG